MHVFTCRTLNSLRIELFWGNTNLDKTTKHFHFLTFPGVDKIREAEIGILGPFIHYIQHYTCWWPGGSSWQGSAWLILTTLIARFMGPTLGLPAADRTQVGPMLGPWSWLSGQPIRISPFTVTIVSCMGAVEGSCFGEIQQITLRTGKIDF